MNIHITYTLLWNTQELTSHSAETLVKINAYVLCLMLLKSSKNDSETFWMVAFTVIQWLITNQEIYCITQRRDL